MAQLSRQGYRRLLIVLFPETESLTGVSYKRDETASNKLEQAGTRAVPEKEEMWRVVRFLWGFYRWMDTSHLNLSLVGVL